MCCWCQHDHGTVAAAGSCRLFAHLVGCWSNEHAWRRAAVARGARRCQDALLYVHALLGFSTVNTGLIDWFAFYSAKRGCMRVLCGCSCMCLPAAAVKCGTGTAWQAHLAIWQPTWSTWRFSTVWAGVSWSSKVNSCAVIWSKKLLFYIRDLLQLPCLHLCFSTVSCHKWWLYAHVTNALMLCKHVLYCIVKIVSLFCVGCVMLPATAVVAEPAVQLPAAVQPDVMLDSV
jgi:hypothetical protein